MIEEKELTPSVVVVEWARRQEYFDGKNPGGTAMRPRASGPARIEKNANGGARKRQGIREPGCSLVAAG